MDDPTPRSSSPSRDYWPFAIGAVHLAHTLWFASAYPEVVYDPDLLAYFVYWKNLVTGRDRQTPAGWHADA